MTIKWQAAGERAIRDACAGSKTMTYCVVRPGSLSDDARCAEDATGKKRVVLGSGGARVHGEDFARGRCGCHRRGASTTRVRGCDYLRGGSGDAERRRARGTLLGSSAGCTGARWSRRRRSKREKFSRRVHVDRRREGRRRTQGKPHRRYVAAFLAFLAGVFVLLVNGS